METKTEHHWRFFRAGGFDQVSLDSAADLAALRSLDQKLWASLASPVTNLELDQRMLGYIDTNDDRRIRSPEVLDAVDWTLAHLADPDALFRGDPLTLASFNDGEQGARLAASARRLLKLLGRGEQDAITVADTDDMSVLFPPNEPNGDGLVPATLTEDPALQEAISDVIACMGAETDRSGEEAVSEAAILEFFEQAQAVYEWHQKAPAATVRPFGDSSEAALAAIDSLREKVEDYFTRVELAAYDPRAAEIMNGGEAELARLSTLSLADTSEVAGLPLAGLHHGDVLPLGAGINPAWQDAVKALREHAVRPVLGDQETLSRDQWRELLARSDEYFSWRAASPGVAILETVPVERIVTLVEQGVQEQLLALVAQDREVAEAAEGLVDLDKLLRFKSGLLTLLRNFVSFRDFYSPNEKAVFQAGRLYIDGKSCDLVVEVNDVAAHSAIAANSNSFLLYCACSRVGQPVRGRETLNIVAAVTAGDEQGLTVGRNGLFYDRDGNDWDATVIKVVDNAISVRQAFWSPYRRVASLVSAQLQKLAADRDNELVADTAGKVGTASTAPAETSAASKTFDIAKFAGIFAAIGLAIGALGAALAAIFSGLMSLLWWQWPLVFLGIIAAISGPAMLMAWFKLRRRSVGPILDANGWAVNTEAKINIPFGTQLTQLAHLPEGSDRSLHDPYAQKRTLWPWLLLIVVVLAGLLWFAWDRGWFAADEPGAAEVIIEAPAEEVVIEAPPEAGGAGE